MNPALLFIIILVIVFWVFIKRSHVGTGQPISKRRGSTTPPKKPMPYHSVSVRPCAVPCEQFKKIRGQRFLTDDIPSLPLDGSNKRFFCSYLYHDDRRDENDRRSNPTATQTSTTLQEKRMNKTERRTSNL